MSRFASTVAVSVLAVCSASAAAMDADVPAAVVRYDDLNITSPDGYRALIARVDKATAFVCGREESRGPARRYNIRRCKSESLNAALAQVEWATPGPPVAGADLPVSGLQAPLSSFAPTPKTSLSTGTRPVIQRGVLNHKGVFVPAKN